MHLVVGVREGNDIEIVRRARAVGVAVEPLSEWYLGGARLPILLAWSRRGGWRSGWGGFWRGELVGGGLGLQPDTKRAG